MNSTNRNNETASASATNIKNASVSYRSTIHPTLRSLWNIPHVIQLPDPMPAPPEVLQLLQKQIARCETQLAALDFSNADHFSTIAACKSQIAILKHKIEELLIAFPDLDEQRSDPAAGLSQNAAAASFEETSNNNQPAANANAHTLQNNFSSAEPEQNSGQNIQPSPPQQTQTRTQPEPAPNSTRTHPNRPKLSPNPSRTNPNQPKLKANPSRPPPAQPQRQPSLLLPPPANPLTMTILLPTSNPPTKTTSKPPPTSITT